MWRFRFGAEDLARVCLAPGASALWEIVLSVQRLCNRDHEHVYDRWRASVRPRLTAGPGLAAAKMLSELAPDGPYFPDFLTPPSSGLSQRIDTVASTPPRVVASQLQLMARYEPVPGWIGALAERDQRPRVALARMLETYYRIVLQPDHDEATARIDVDRRTRAAALADGGVAALFGSFPEQVLRWQRNELTIAIGLHQLNDLRGRGVTMVPSMFCWKHATGLADAELPPTVIYPVAASAPRCPTDENSHRAEVLIRLLGNQRAKVLLAVREGATTAELADRLEIAASTVSYHVAALRDSGLVGSRRQQGILRHQPTQLGWCLIYGDAE